MGIQCQTGKYLPSSIRGKFLYLRYDLDSKWMILSDLYSFYEIGIIVLVMEARWYLRFCIVYGWGMVSCPHTRTPYISLCTPSTSSVHPFLPICHSNEIKFYLYGLTNLYTTWLPMHILQWNCIWCTHLSMPFCTPLHPLHTSSVFPPCPSTSLDTFYVFPPCPSAPPLHLCVPSMPLCITSMLPLYTLIAS